MPGPPPRGDRAATPAERSAAYRARRKAILSLSPRRSAGGCPIPPARRSAQSTATVGCRGADAGRPAGPVSGVAGQPALRPREQRDGGSTRCRAGTARLCRRARGGRAAKGLRTRLTTLIGSATGRALAEQMALATSGAVHIRLLGSPPARPRLRLAVRRRPLPPQNAGMMAR
jgi:hypothetical protein